MPHVPTPHPPTFDPCGRRLRGPQIELPLGVVAHVLPISRRAFTFTSEPTPFAVNAMLEARDCVALYNELRRDVCDKCRFRARWVPAEIDMVVHAYAAKFADKGIDLSFCVHR
eukprot:6172354-Pleurochrysis_carterae.AAC.1